MVSELPGVIGPQCEKKRKNNARTLYRHEYEPVIQMPNTTSRVVT